MIDLNVLSINSAVNTFDLELFFQSTPDLLCIAGFDGYFKKINPMVSKTLGYTNEELFSRPINDFVHPDDQALTSKNRENLRNAIPLLNFENRYVTKSGEIVWLLWTSISMQAEQVVFAIAKNITHKRKIDEDRNNQLSYLTKANSELKKMIYTASHDLRSPVNNLLSVFALIEQGRLQPDDIDKLLHLLKLSANTLYETLNNYIDALIKKDILNVRIEEISLSESSSRVLKSLQSLIQDSNAKIKLDFSASNQIKFNTIYLESVLLNLITNAIKYKKAHEYPEITIYSLLKEGQTQLVVQDNGVGFDMAAVKNKIFGFTERFNNNNDSKGIGLYLVHSHITTLGGVIEVESSINQGAKFIITFK